MCNYYNEKREFPIVWRCRPWYVASSLNAYITFAETYSDLASGALATTISIKIVDSTNLRTINQEDDVEPYVI